MISSLVSRLRLTGNHDLAEALLEVTGGINDPYIFKAVILAGGPGSGKSFIGEHMFKGLGLKWYASDRQFEFLLKKRGLPLKLEKGNKDQYQTREDAKVLTNLQKVHWINGMLGIILDGTGQNKQKILGAKAGLENIGYDTSMVFVKTSLDVAQDRNAARERSLPPEDVEKIWRTASANGKVYKSAWGSDFFVVENNERLDEKGMAELGKRLRSKALNWLKRPLQNPKGQTAVELLKKHGGKTLSDLPDIMMREAADKEAKTPW